MLKDKVLDIIQAWLPISTKTPTGVQSRESGFSTIMQLAIKNDTAS